MEQAARGAVALKASNYAEAVAYYTDAIKQQPTAANHYIQRSIANQRTSRFQEALSDAEQAVILATERQRRELIAQAQLRRATACFSLEKYGDAENLFVIAKKLNPNEKSIAIWEAKVAQKLHALPDDDKKRKITMQELPDKKVEAPVRATNGTPDTAKEAKKPEAQKEAVAASKPSQIRHEWYQNNEKVYLTLLAKGVSNDQATIEITEQSCSISFPLPTGSTYDFSIDPLFAPISPSDSTSRILSTKVELVLQKLTPGQKWSALEGETSKFLDSNPDIGATHIVASNPAPIHVNKNGPAYPTSSRTGPKNWDKIMRDMSKKGDAKKDADAEVKPDDSIQVDSDDEGGDEVNAFFKKLYKGADPDTRRAMIKSYQESNGTALSTNWLEVGKGKVEMSPPDGMEARKWDS